MSFWKSYRFTWKSACSFIITSGSKIQNFRTTRSRLMLQQAKNKFNQPNTAGRPNLVSLQPRRAELMRLQFWSDFPEILDLTFWSTNKTTCWFSVESVKFWKTVGFPSVHETNLQIVKSCDSSIFRVWKAAEMTFCFAHIV